MKHPLALPTVLYAAGLLCAEHVRLPWMPLVAVALGLLLAAVVMRLHRVWLLSGVCFFAAYLNFAVRTEATDPSDLRNTSAEPAQIVNVRGTLVRPVEQRTRTFGLRESSRTLAWLEAESLLSGTNDWRSVSGKLLVITPGTLPKGYYGGSAVEIVGVMRRPPGPEAEGLFDYREYLSRLNIHFELRTSGSNDWAMLNHVPQPLSERFIEWARETLGRGVPEDGLSLALLRSMTLGDRGALENETYEPFMRTGTMHVFAISGLHVALITWMLVVALRAMRLPRSVCGLIAIPIIWFYTAATGWQPSAVRAAIMSSVVLAGWALPRPSNLLNSLCASALIILLVDPQQLFGPSFQLSFAVVLSIAILLPRLTALHDRWLRHNPLVPPDAVPRWRKTSLWAVRGLAGMLGVSLAAWLGALPFTIYYFHLFNPITLLANIVVVPLSTVALGLNVTTLVTGDLLSTLTVLLNQAAVWTMDVIVCFCDSASNLHWGVRHMRAWSAAEVLVYYLLLAAAFSGRLFQGPFRWWAMGTASTACGAWMLFLTQTGPATRLTVFPAEGGASIHLSAGGQECLIDCGKTNIARRLVTPYLIARGVNVLDWLVLTHGDLSHVGGAGFIETHFKRRSVTASPVRFRSPVYREIIEGAEASGALKQAGSGDAVGPWRVLHPSREDRASRADEACMVLWGQFNGTRVLLVPDLNRAGQELLLNRAPRLDADVVIAGLPDEGEPLCDALLERINPSVVVLVDANYPAYCKAKPALLDRLRASCSQVIATSVEGVTYLTFEQHGRPTIRTQGRAEDYD